MKVLRDDYTGRVEQANTDLIYLLLNNGYLPVITPPAISFESDAINVDGDRAAAVLAQALKADTLLLLSNVPGSAAQRARSQHADSHRSSRARSMR